MGFRVVSGYFLDIKWIIRRQYASYIPLHPISGQYLDYMPVLCRQYMAYLPFTGILPVIHGLLYLNSTMKIISRFSMYLFELRQAGGKFD